MRNLKHQDLTVINHEIFIEFRPDSRPFNNPRDVVNLFLFSPSATFVASARYFLKKTSVINETRKSGAGSSSTNEIGERRREKLVKRKNTRRFGLNVLPSENATGEKIKHILLGTQCKHKRCVKPVNQLTIAAGHRRTGRPVFI